jgi:hypothetical protein
LAAGLLDHEAIDMTAIVDVRSAISPRWSSLEGSKFGTSNLAHPGKAQERFPEEATVETWS